MFLLDCAWPTDPEDVITISIELGIFAAGIVAGIIGLFIWKNYRVLAKKGLPECVSGFFVFAFHSLFDALDTSCGDPLKDSFDQLDSIFSIIGLALVALGLLRISLYGAKIWREL